MNWVDQLKENIPDYAKDTRLNLDAVVKRSNLSPEVAESVALAAAFATGNTKLWQWIHSQLTNEIEREAAIIAASLMAMNNTWYPYVEMTDDADLRGLPAGLRMNAYATSGGTSKDNFEAYALAASIVGKCHFCVKSHYDLLKKNGWSVKQLQDIGKIASVISAVAKVMV